MMTDSNVLTATRSGDGDNFVVPSGYKVPYTEQDYSKIDLKPALRGENQGEDLLFALLRQADQYNDRSVKFDLSKFRKNFVLDVNSDINVRSRSLAFDMEVFFGPRLVDDKQRELTSSVMSEQSLKKTYPMGSLHCKTKIQTTDYELYLEVDDGVDMIGIEIPVVDQARDPNIILKRHVRGKNGEDMRIEIVELAVAKGGIVYLTGEQSDKEVGRKLEELWGIDISKIQEGVNLTGMIHSILYGVERAHDYRFQRVEMNPANPVLHFAVGKEMYLHNKEIEKKKLS